LDNSVRALHGPLAKRTQPARNKENDFRGAMQAAGGRMSDLTVIIFLIVLAVVSIGPLILIGIDIWKNEG
jgi:hypothetical protein